MNLGFKEKILELKAKGLSNKEISNALGCCKSVITYHVREKKKIGIKKKNLCSCGNYKSLVAERCQECENKLRREKLMSRTLGDIKDSTSNKNNPFHLVRAQARMIMEESKAKHECAICGFSEYVETCHIKAISDFTLDTRVSEVNRLDNLVYLCPNHHILLDRNKLSNEEISAIKLAARSNSPV